MISIGITGLGAILMWASRDFGSRGENVLAGFLLGALLFVAGAVSLLAGGAQTVTIDPRKRVIEVADARPLGSKRALVAFQDVVGISIGYLGKKSNFVNMYYLVLHLVDGREFPLFAPGRFFEGASDRNVVEGWRARLEEYLRLPQVRG